ncbi:MAG: aminoacyl-tRNA hydrolase [Candidatus Krumholzibacteriia bacterium]
MTGDFWMVAGLGNPGDRYRDTRHNIGFRVVEALAASLGLPFGEEGGPYRAATGRYEGRDLVLLEPLTFMNLSGRALEAWARIHGRPLTVFGPGEAGSGSPADGAADPVPAEPGPRGRLLVVCDDLHLPLGACRMRGRGGSGGQNGLASIIEVLGHEEVARLRLGIAVPGEGVPPADWADFVLEPFAPAEACAVAEMVAHGAAAAECWLARGLQEAVGRFNRRAGPEAPEG